MHRALGRHGLDHVRTIGFDSFQGLPESAASEDRGVWLPGDFSVGVATTRQFLVDRGVDMRRVELVEGWFDDTATPERAEALGIEKASVVMIDCDLYSSAKTALEFCAPLLADEAVIFFDDWASGGLDERRMGERRAFEEFLEENRGFTASEIESYGPRTRTFVVSRQPAEMLESRR
jgi:hypothetical protein